MHKQPDRVKLINSNRIQKAFLRHHCKRFACASLYQNTYTNADKLLEAAEQLAQTGECDPEEIYQAARQLEDRIQDFVRRVEQRKVLLDMSVAFHTHVKEVKNKTRQNYECSTSVLKATKLFFCGWKALRCLSFVCSCGRGWKSYRKSC